MTATHSPAPHVPVMVNEVLAGLALKDGGVYVDATFGAGGYSRAILSAANCQLHAFDRDPSVAVYARQLKDGFGDLFHWYEERFSDMERVLRDNGIDSVDGIALDIGISSMHIDEAERGFSFQKDGPLDMRMSQKGVTAAQFVNEADAETLTAVIRDLGEERHAKRVVRAIVERRSQRPFERTADLASVVDAAVPKNPKQKIHGATKTFQAIRIYINNELEELRSGLLAAERMLRPHGRLVVVVFHSLEDRLVKTFLSERAEPSRLPSRHAPFDPTAPSVRGDDQLTFRYVGKRLQKPSKDEIESNPRSRSAKLRIAERTNRPYRKESNESGGIEQ